MVGIRSRVSIIDPLINVYFGQWNTYKARLYGRPLIPQSVGESNNKPVVSSDILHVLF